MHGQPELLQVVGALRPPRRLARRLDRGEQQSDQHRDDRDDHEQLDEGEPAAMKGGHGVVTHAL